MSSSSKNSFLPAHANTTHAMGLLAVPDGNVVVGGHYAPMIGEDRRVMPATHEPMPLYMHGEPMLRLHSQRALREHNDVAVERRDARHQAHQNGPPPVVRPEVLYKNPPITAHHGRLCNFRQVDRCRDLFLELLGWGVPMEHLVDMGFSLPGVIWLCANLRIRLSEGLVLRAQVNRLPFHPDSIMPEGYKGYAYPAYPGH